MNIVRRRPPYVPSREPVECGAASLTMVLRAFGHHAELSEVREATGVSRDSVSAKSIVHAARSYGLLPRARRLSPEALAGVQGPAILHWEADHFVVLDQWTPSGVRILDPDLGPRTVSLADLAACFTGVCIDFSLGDAFVRRPRRRAARSGGAALGMDPAIESTPTFRALRRRFEDQPRLAEVPRLPWPSSRDDLAPTARAGYPAILCGHPCATMPAGAMLDRLATLGSAREVGVSRMRGRKAEPCEAARALRRVRLASYAEALQSGAGARVGYVANEPLSAEEARRLGAPPPHFFRVEDFEPPSLWLGPGGAGTGLHKDTPDNFAFHLVGRKRWILFPIRDAHLLYLKRTSDAAGFSDFACSDVDPAVPDPRRFPLAGEARGLRVDVNAGEVLFLPAGWAHHVEALDVSLMVNYWLNPAVGGPLALGGFDG